VIGLSHARSLSAERGRLRIWAERLDGAARYLASLPCWFTVVAPPEPRRELRRLADRLAAS